MTMSHRVQLVKLARKYDALIVTDDVYDFLQWHISPSVLSVANVKSPMETSLKHSLVPRLVDIDRTLEPVPDADSFGNVVSNGSFSKIAAPGVRTGWGEGTRRFSYGLSQCGSSRSGGAPSHMTATIIDQMLRTSSLQAHVENVLKPAYQRRFHLMLEAIQKYLVPLGVTVGEGTMNNEFGVFGGYFIWIELPPSIDAELVARLARTEESLIIAAGKLFEVRGDESIKFPHSVRLAFSSVSEEHLTEGVARLARVLRQVIRDGGQVDSRAKAYDVGKYI